MMTKDGLGPDLAIYILLIILTKNKKKFISILFFLMKQTKNFQRIQNAIDQSLIHCMLINPLLYPTLSHELTRPIPGFTLKSFNYPYYDYKSILIKMNPVLLEDITEEEKEINSIIQEDNCEQLKMKFINHLLNPNQKDRNEISLIEKCVFFDSKQCLNYLLE